ncbi:hypothetical protein AAG570_005443 [Ranatra chinensis]|uniref:Uncharacterized protein n=1 Tax=Ranatra chinensis TaxID=642074 RepID=A0ABD0YCG8_9HEMI
MESKRRNMFYQNKKQERTEIDACLLFAILLCWKYNTRSFVSVRYHPNLRPEVVEVTYEDALLDAAAKFYGPKTNKVLAPLPSFRRGNEAVMGFASVADNYCGHSEYQEGVSKTGYLVMKDSLGEGEKRMLRRKPSPPPLPPLPPLPPTDFTLLPEEERRQMWR